MDLDCCFSEASRAGDAAHRTALLNALPAAAVIANTSGDIVEASTIAEEIFGYSQGAMPGCNYLELFPEHLRSEIRLFCETSMVSDDAGTRLLESVGLRRDGNEFPIKLKHSRYVTPDASMHVLGIRDITEKRMIDARFRALLEAAPDAMVIINEAGSIEFINRQTEQMFGFSQGELIGQTVEMLVPVRLRERHLEHRVKYCQSPSVRPMGMGVELFGLRKNGEEFPVEISLSPIRQHDELLVIAAARDMTERRNAEAANRRRERLASLGTVTAGIAHEINNPVGAALLTAETANALLERAGSQPQVSECLNKVIESMKRCGNIVQSILRFAREDRLQRFDVDLNAIVQKAFDFVREYAESHQVLLQLALCEHLPPVLASPLEIELVIVNVIRNAVEACRESGRVLVETNADSRAATFRVQDNGRGMTDKERERVFDPFYRAVAKPDGTGLGMSIVYGIVAEHAGNVIIDTTPGGGTLVSIELPYSESGRSASEPRAG